MLQVLQKWQVTVTKSDGTNVQFWVSDNFLGNVIRKVADMQFERGIAQPRRVVIEPESGAERVQA